MKVAALFSGGKDSAYAAYLCQSWGWDVELVTVEPEKDSMMFHHPNTRWCPLQARAMGLRHSFVERKSNDELQDLQDALLLLKKTRGIRGIVSGAVASEYQKQRIEIIGENCGLPTFNPLWHKGEAVLREMSDSMEIIVVSVSAEGLDEKWLGRKFDGAAIDELGAMPSKPNIFFEGGEAETFVCNALFFKKAIRIKKSEKNFDGVRGTLEIRDAGPA